MLKGCQERSGDCWRSKQFKAAPEGAIFADPKFAGDKISNIVIVNKDLKKKSNLVN